MKRIVFVAVVIGLWAAMPVSAIAAEDWTAKCKSVSELAQTIMKSRQAGVSMSSLIDMEIDPGIRALVTNMVMEAYDSPRYNTEDIKQQTISDFRDEWYLKCAKASTK